MKQLGITDELSWGKGLKALTKLAIAKKTI